LYDFEAQALMGGDGDLMTNEMEERDQLMLELQKLAVSEGAVWYLEILRRRQERDIVKLGLLMDLLRHARDEAHQRQLDLDVVDCS
nr:hypothetical protein [Tanacetum cinerariifolium]